MVIPLYPIILFVGLIFIIYAWILSLWQRLTTSKTDFIKQDQDILEAEIQRNKWNAFISTNNILIEKQHVGSLPWDSGYYLHLRSNASIPYLTDKIFGDWLFVDFDGIFLQKWNDTRSLNCDLAFINCVTLKVTILKENLPTIHWIAKKLNTNEIQFTFTTAEYDLIYIVKQTEII